MKVEQATGEAVARAVAAKAARGAFGVLIRDVPLFDLEAFLRTLGAAGARLRIAMPGLEDGEAARLAEVAARAGFGSEHFVSTVEGAERWRNDVDVRDTIVVVIPREIPKLNSLNRFQALTADDLYQQVCMDAEGALVANEAQRQLWRALGQKKVSEAVPVVGLLAFYAALAEAPDQAPQRSRESLHLLGLLPDPSLLTKTSAAHIARRLKKNQEVVDQLSVLSSRDRQKMSRSLTSQTQPASRRLKAIYKKVMAFYREQDPALLRGLTLDDVQCLLSGKRQAAEEPTRPAELPDEGEGDEREQRKPERNPEVRAIDLLVDGDGESLAELADAVRESVASDERGADEVRDPQVGNVLDVKAKHPFRDLIERMVSPDRWGGLVECDEATTLNDALATLDKAACKPFDPDGLELRRMLEGVPVEPRSRLLRHFEGFIEARQALAGDVSALLLYPLVQLNSTPEYFSTATRYLESYEALIQELQGSYDAIAKVARKGVAVLSSRLLALDTIVIRTRRGLKAVLSPLHPLHLWKYIKLCQQLRVRPGATTDADLRLLRARIAELPNFVTTLYVSSFITRERALTLPEAGSLKGIPYYEELVHQYAGRDGVDKLRRIFEKFCALYPHAQLGLRVMVIDPPDVEEFLREVVKIADHMSDRLQAVHVRLRFTSEGHSAVAGLGGGSTDEDGPERFRGVGTWSQFTLEAAEEPQELGAITRELKAHPAHIAVYFDPSTASTQRFERTPSLKVSPLCLPMQFEYDRIMKTVRVVPAADGGVFADHNDLRGRLDQAGPGAFFGVNTELARTREALADLTGGCTWLVVADRAQEGALTLPVPRVSLQRAGKRDVAIFQRDLGKFVDEFDRQLRRANYTPHREAVEGLIQDLGELLTDGLLALISSRSGQARAALDERRTRGILGTLVTSAWYRRHHRRSLMVSIDSPEARLWLDLREDPSRADLFGVADESDGSIIVDIVEVKTYEQPEGIYQLAGDQIRGDAVDQLLSTARIVEEIFELTDTPQHPVAPQRREVLRQHLFRECFFEGRSDDDKQYWSERLNRLFALDVEVKLRLSLVIVGLTQVKDESRRPFRAGGRDVWLIELTEDVVRRHVSNEPLTAPATPDASAGGGSPHASTPRPRAQGQAPTPSAHGVAPTAQGSPPSGPRGASERPSPAASAVSDSHPLPAGEARTPSQPEAQAPGSTPEPENGSALAVGEAEQAQIKDTASKLARALRGYGVEVRELDADKAQVGPTVVRYRVRLGVGAKVATLRSRAEDLGRELASRTTPIIDNIPGEHYVGFDLERPQRQTVPLLPAVAALPKREGLQLPLAVGMTPSGEHVCLDLVTLPHVLVAGSTRSGKTVFLHALLLSLIGRIPPTELELLLIDPKATDFVLYNGLPYLRGGRVITEAQEAVEALRQLTNDELQSRTATLQQARRSNLADYNAANPEAKLKPIVVVIDEYADLMAVLDKRAKADFEREINRLGQRARSVGIHLVLATQRPTVDVVTGLLKANLPCRVSFRLPQRVDSQTILDQPGAENLFGSGDMLLLNSDRVTRLQGYYASTDEMDQFLQARFPGTGQPPPLEPVEGSLDLTVDESDRANREALVGEVTCLAAGPDRADLLDGAVLPIEVERKAGEGAEVIGMAGDVLRQSVLAVWRHVQRYAKDYEVNEGDLRDTGVSVHLVNIAQFKEGPSAGVAFAVAMISALTERPVRPGLAMTGEVSLKGHVTAVGGVPQKLIAAFRRGRKEVILPAANLHIVELLPEEVRRGLKIHPVASVREAIEIALG